MKRLSHRAPGTSATPFAGEGQPCSIPAGLVAVAVLLLCWPLAYNGFPLVFSDTGTYIASGIERLVPIDRPIFYGAFLAAAANFGGLSVVAVAQSTFVAYTTVLFIQWFAPHAPRLAVAAAICIIALLTPVAWLASWLMPDVFGALVVLAVILFVLAFRDLAVPQRLWLGAVLLLALLSHTGNLLMFGGLLVLTVLVAVVRRLPISWSGVGTAVLIALTAIFLAMLSNALAHGRWTINPGSQAFLAARLVGDGLMKPFLDRHCPAEPDLPLCADRERLVGMTNNNFLWDQPSLGDSTGVWTRSADAYSALNRRVIQENFGQIAEAAVRNTFELIGRSELGGDHLDHNLRSFSEEATSTRQQVERYFPGEVPRFLAARQQTEQLHLNALNWLHRWWTWISYALLIVAALAAYRVRNDRVLALLCTIAGSLLLNAAVHGALSGVYTRYQVKVTWLATLGAIAALLAMSRWSRVPTRAHAEPRPGPSCPADDEIRRG